MKLAKLKTAIGGVVEPKGKPGKISIAYHIIMGIIVVLSCVAVFVELGTKNEILRNNLHIFEIVTVSIFAVECLIKLFIAEYIYPDKGVVTARIAYLTSFDFFIDLVCILSIFLNQLPTTLGTIKFIKLIKLTRLVKLGDVNDGENLSGSKKENRLKRRIYEIIAEDKKDLFSRIYDVLAILLILASVSVIIVETFVKEDTPAYTVLFTFEMIFTVFFIIEYCLRIWTAEYEYPHLDPDHAKMKYIFSFMAIMDLLAILPFFFMLLPGQEEIGHSIAVVKIFKLFRITRLVKFSRYFSAFTYFGESIKKKGKQIIFSVVVIAFIICLWSILLYSFEKDNNPEVFKNGFSGILYACQIMVGGDNFFDASTLKELTTMGDVMVVLMLLSGGCLIGVPLGIISGEFGKMIASADKEKEDTTFDALVEKLTPEQKKEIVSKYLPDLVYEEEMEDTKE